MLACSCHALDDRNMVERTLDFCVPPCRRLLSCKLNSMPSQWKVSLPWPRGSGTSTETSQPAAEKPGATSDRVTGADTKQPDTLASNQAPGGPAVVAVVVGQQPAGGAAQATEPGADGEAMDRETAAEVQPGPLFEADTVERHAVTATSAASKTLLEPASPDTALNKPAQDAVNAKGDYRCTSACCTQSAHRLNHYVTLAPS